MNRSLFPQQQRGITILALILAALFVILFVLWAGSTSERLQQATAGGPYGTNTLVQTYISQTATAIVSQ